jgi:hypothetical protein
MSTWNLCSKVVFLLSKLVCLAIQFFLNKIVSLCDTHWGNLNKFANFAKFVKMVRAQRVKL